MFSSMHCLVLNHALEYLYKFTKYITGFSNQEGFTEIKLNKLRSTVL